MSLINLNCILCDSPCHSTASDPEEDKQHSENLWNVFSKFFNLSLFATEWKFILNYYTPLFKIPFCAVCQNQLDQLLALEEKYNSIQQNISKLVATISSTIILSESQPNFSCAMKSVGDNKSVSNSSKFKSKENLDEIHCLVDSKVNSNISKIRNAIFQHYNPRVDLINCQPKDSNSQPQSDDKEYIKKEACDSQVDQDELVFPVKDEWTEFNTQESDPMTANKEMNFGLEDYDTAPQVDPTETEELVKVKVEVVDEDMELLYLNSLNQQQDQLPHDPDPDPLNLEDQNELNDPLYIPPDLLVKTKRQLREKSHQNKIEGDPQPNLHFHCKFCDKEFVTGFNFYRHSITVHSMNMEEAKEERIQQSLRRSAIKRKLKGYGYQVVIPKKKNPQVDTRKLDSYQPLQLKEGEIKFLYKGWEYKKTREGLLICVCGARRSLTFNMIAHLKDRHLTFSKESRRSANNKNGDFSSDPAKLFDLVAVVPFDDGCASDKKYSFHCTQCDRCFVKGFNLRRHLTEVHKMSLKDAKDFQRQQSIRRANMRRELTIVDGPTVLGQGQNEATSNDEGTSMKQPSAMTLLPNSDGHQLGYQMTSNGIFVCCSCGTKRITRVSMEAHVASHNNLDSSPYIHKCPNCPAAFVQKQNLEHHVHRCTYLRQEWKSVGQDQFKYQNKWLVTIEQDGQEDDNRSVRYKCCTCGLTRKDKASLGRHISETHIRPLAACPWTCPTCGKSFRSKWHLQDHKSCHFKNKYFQCTLKLKENPNQACKLRFKTQRHLSRHQELSHHVQKELMRVNDQIATSTTSQVLFKVEEIEQLNDPGYE